MNSANKAAVILATVAIFSAPAFADKTAAEGMKDKAKSMAADQAKPDAKKQVMDKAKEKGMEKGKEAAGKMLKK